MSIEDELRDSLRRRVASVQVQPDLGDVSGREAKRDRRARHLLAAGLVVALIAGPLAGFAIGNGRDDGGSDVATGSGAAGQQIARSADDAAMSAPEYASGTPLEKLFVRTSADGVVIRAYRSVVPVPTPTPTPEPEGCVDGPEVDCPATAECIDTIVVPASTVTGELSTEAAVTVASGSAGVRSTDNPDVAVSEASWGTFGVEETAPARWVIASVSERVARVRVAFPGGATDEMEPVDGVVILASLIDDPSAEGGALEALDADGAVVGRVDLSPGFGGVSNSAGGSSGWGSSGGAVDSRAEVHTESSSDGSGSSASSSVSSGSPGVSATCVTLLPAPAPAVPVPDEQPTDPGTATPEPATGCSDPSLAEVTCSPAK